MLNQSHKVAMRFHVFKTDGGLIRCLSSSPSLSVGLSMGDELMNVALSAQRGAYYHAGGC